MGKEAKKLQNEGDTNPLWKGIVRDCTAEEVISLRPSFFTGYDIAKFTSKNFRADLLKKPFVLGLGCMSGHVAENVVKAGVEAIYMGGWQIAAAANQAKQCFPDQSLYPSNSVPEKIEEINNFLRRQEEIELSEGKVTRNWYVPIIADAEAGWGGSLHAGEIMKAMILAGAAGIHFEDQLASAKKCGHLAGKVIIPTKQFIEVLKSARLEADILDIPAVLIARTDANSAKFLQNDSDPYDAPFITGQRTPEGFFVVKNGVEAAISRGLAYAPYADMLWFETSRPDLDEAKEFAQAIHQKFPDKLFAYNLSSSFNWLLPDKKYLSTFQETLAENGYRFQFITIFEWHATALATFTLARDIIKNGMRAYADFQQKEFDAQKDGYTAVRHQRESGAGFFDKKSLIISGGQSSTLALKGSTEEQQFYPKES